MSAWAEGHYFECGFQGVVLFVRVPSSSKSVVRNCNRAKRFLYLSGLIAKLIDTSPNVLLTCNSIYGCAPGDNNM